MLEGSGEERESFTKFVKKVFSQKKKWKEIFYQATLRTSMKAERIDKQKVFSLYL